MQNLQYYTQETPCDILIHYNSSMLMFTLKKDRTRKAYVGPVK